MSKETIFLHIGMHKTGSTAIQSFLAAHRERLARNQFSVYRGMFIPDNHVELHLAAMRDERLSPYKLRHNIHRSDDFIREVTNSVANFVAMPGSKIFSSEGVSYLRYPDELETLERIFSQRTLQILVYVRERSEWMRSYAAEMKFHPLPSTIDKDSFAYLSEDSWLLDFDARIAAFRCQFGDKNVTALDYEKCLDRDGSIIPSFLRWIGAANRFLPAEWQGFWRNVTAEKSK